MTLINLVETAKERPRHAGQFRSGALHPYRGLGARKKKKFETDFFRKVVLEHVSSDIPKRSNEIFLEVLNDWGTTCKRRVIRALAYLRRNRRVSQGSDFFYVKSSKRSPSRSLPKN